MGLWLASIAANSSQELEELVPIMTEKQIIIDGIMAQSMLSTTSSIMRSHLEAEETFKLQHNFSGLRIIQTFSKIINKKTAKGCQQALALMMTRKPVEQPQMLYSALQVAQEDIDNLIQQGGEADSQLRMALLTNMTKKLVQMPQMTLPLTIPIDIVTRDHPSDPDQLYKVLRDIAEDLLREAGFSVNTAPKVMAVPGRKDDRERQKQNGTRPQSDALCPFYREGLKPCPIKNCNRKHEGRTGKVCESED